MKAVSRSRVVVVIVSTMALGLVVIGATSAHAQLLYSFETANADKWTIVAVQVPTSTTLGVTDGAKSMLIDNLGPNFNNDVGTVTEGADREPHLRRGTRRQWQSPPVET